MAVSATRTTGTLVMLAVVFSSLAGLVCAEGPDEALTMECCRGEAHHCNMPSKSDDTEDCCKPDRSSENPASVATPTRSAAELESSPQAAVLTVAITPAEAGYRVAPFVPPRSSPVPWVNRPLDIPLLN